MRFGTPMFIGHLQVGDVVRPIRGGIGTASYPGGRCNPDANKITYTNPDGTKSIFDPLGWKGPVLGGQFDYRDAYDTMTVCKVTNKSVSFLRPYFHLNRDGSLSTGGLEHVDDVPRNSNRWYELLS